eukprot:scaffold8271_cov149-Skeletonema_marinoi.AAC.2
MSESYSPLKDFASPQGGASCDTSPLSFNITNHIHHSVGVAFGQSTVTSPVTMSQLPQRAAFERRYGRKSRE